MHILPTNGWFSGFRRFLTNWVTLTLVGILMLMLIIPISHDRLRQHEVAVAVRQLWGLQPGTASSKEVIAFAQKHGLIAFSESDGKYVKHPCDGSDCVFEGVLQSDPFISWVTTQGSDLTGIKAAWFEALKVRPWVVRFIVTIEQGRLEGSTVIFGTTQPIPLHPYEGWWWNQVSVAHTADINDQITSYDLEKYGSELLRNPNYVSWNRKSLFLVAVTKQANRDELDAAFSVDLGCLSKHPCHRWGHVVPKAWNRFCSHQSPESNLYSECFGEK